MLNTREGSSVAAKERLYTLIRLIGEDENYHIWEATRSIIADSDTEKAQKRRYRLHLLKEDAKVFDSITAIHAAIDEIRLLSHIYHKNCPYIEDAGEIDTDGNKRFFFAEHWWEGYTIKEILMLAKHFSTHSSKFLIPVGAALWTAREIADALDHIHTLHDEKGVHLNIIHRDIKPEHICYTKEARVMLTGFSVSKSNSNLFTTIAGQIRGISPYMAPERLTSDTTINGVKADIFSLGCVLFEMIMGFPRMRLSTAGIPDINSLRRSVNMCALRKSIHPRLQKLINKMTMLEPEKRPDSAEEVRDGIDILLDAPPYRCFASDIEGFVLYMLTQDREGYLAIQRLLEREKRLSKEKPHTSSIIINPNNSPELKSSSGKYLSTPSAPLLVQSNPSVTPKPSSPAEIPAPEEKNNLLASQQWADIQKNIDAALQSTKTQSIRKHKQTLIGATLILLVAFIALMIIGLNIFKKNLLPASASQFTTTKTPSNPQSFIISDHIVINKEYLLNANNGTLTLEINVASNASLMIQVLHYSGIKQEATDTLLQQAYKKINGIDWTPYRGRHFTYKINVIGK